MVDTRRFAAPRQRISKQVDRINTNYILDKNLPVILSIKYFRS